VAQYDVHANPNVQQRRFFPYLVEIQSDQLSHYPTRLMMPLAAMPNAPVNVPRRLAETVQIHGARLFLAAHLCAHFPVQLLKQPSVASLRHEASLFVNALDAVISGV
jgi:toxin CcdB